MGILALESDVFFVLATIVFTALVVVGLVLSIAKSVSNKDLSKVSRTYRSWWLMAPLPFMAVLLGREATILLSSALSVLIFLEYASATGLGKDGLMKWTVLACIAVQSLVTLITDPKLMTPGWYGMFMALPVYAICGIAMLPVLRNRSHGQLQNVALATFGYLYFGWMFGHLAFLTNTTHAVGYLLYLIFAVSVADISAYITGSLFGEVKLRDQVSPNKTVAGSVGALTVSLGLPWAMRFAFPDFTTIELLLTGLIIGVGGQLGDLTISYIKRDVGIKDMGSVIPGHGGLLDRLDSLIFTAPIFFHMTRWFQAV